MDTQKVAETRANQDVEVPLEDSCERAIPPSDHGDAGHAEELDVPLAPGFGVLGSADEWEEVLRITEFGSCDTYHTLRQTITLRGWDLYAGRVAMGGLQRGVEPAVISRLLTEIAWDATSEPDGGERLVHELASCALSGEIYWGAVENLRQPRMDSPLYDALRIAGRVRECEEPDFREDLEPDERRFYAHELLCEMVRGMFRAIAAQAPAGTGAATVRAFALRFEAAVRVEVRRHNAA